MTTVNGEVAGGFEPVRATFEQVVDAGDLGEGGAAYAAYHQGAKVVDLWAGEARSGEKWGRDTTNMWMSVAKAMTALCMQILHDRDQLDIDASVASYWPDFGQAGKEAITVRQVLTHSCGLPGSPELSGLIDLETGAGVDEQDKILATIEAMEPMWEPGTQVGYHALTYSWILGEVLRRIDGRSLGDFFREDVALPLGCDDAYIGTPVEEHDRIANTLPIMAPPGAPDIAVEYMDQVFAGARDPETPAGRSLLGNGQVSALDRIPEVFDSLAGRTAELGGSGLVGTARSIARILAAVVEPGGLDGVELASPESLATFSDVQTTDTDVVLLIPIARALGYWRNISLAGRPQACGPNEETVAHSGLGGQLGFADPVARVAGAYTRNHHTKFPVAPLLLNNAVYACLG
jgi:CubicO group peptidase (beta-lactamase class C family)